LDLPELTYQSYRDRGDAENNFDELKNQWGGPASRHKTGSVARSWDRIVASVYNWRTMFMRLGRRGNTERSPRVRWHGTASPV